ncbi:replication initiation protein [Acinetobacter baumannii]|nr:replication initiation protein [Acinetobacter baumannii]MDQ9848125.1 replication initiation protein [Acinetobacter baumannii]MDQ9855423.1 replication initiation protein [Acinetobacter baumannii]MDQ9866856.1 replication initiation protein [Acinetobacter baumannii]
MTVNSVNLNSKKYFIINRLYENLPKKPYCTSDFFGLKIRDKKQAIRHSHIQINHPNFKRYIVIDADYPGAATAWRYDFDDNIPVPNLIVVNPENTHCHFYYELEAPVSFTESSSKRAQEFYNSVSKKLTEVLKGDSKYVGLIAKNPAHEKWIVEVPRLEKYSLHELVEHLELKPHEYRNINSEKPGIEKFVINGRNDHLFNEIRHQAYIDIRSYRSKTFVEWFDHVKSLLINANKNFSVPLPYSEVCATAKSIAKYCWKKDSYCFQEFCERQHIKAKKGGRAKSDKYVEMRRTAARLLRSGKTKTYISELLQVSYRSVLRWLQGIKVQAAIMHLSELKKLCDNAQNQILACFIASLIVIILDEHIYDFNESEELKITIKFKLKVPIQ